MFSSSINNFDFSCAMIRNFDEFISAPPKKKSISTIPFQEKIEKSAAEKCETQKKLRGKSYKLSLTPAGSQSSIPVRWQKANGNGYFAKLVKPQKNKTSHLWCPLHIMRVQLILLIINCIVIKRPKIYSYAVKYFLHRGILEKYHWPFISRAFRLHRKENNVRQCRKFENKSRKVLFMMVCRLSFSNWI